MAPSGGQMYPLPSCNRQENIARANNADRDGNVNLNLQQSANNGIKQKL